MSRTHIRRGRRFRRLAAMASMLVAASSGSSAAPDRGPPRNARECGLIIDDIVFEQLEQSSPTMLTEFLKNTNIDRILEKLCAEGRYEEAYRVGQGFLGGRTEPPKGPAPNSPECNRSENMPPWSIGASADRYVLSRPARITSFDEKRVNARIGGSVAVIESIADGSSQIVLRPYFLSSFAPQSLDVVLKTASGEERQGTVPVEHGSVVVLTTLMKGGTNAGEIEVMASLAGAPVFSAVFEIQEIGKAQYQGMVLAHRLKEMRDRGACHDRPCFLTTACCDLIGLSDDCFELRALRRFRDEVLAGFPQGEGEIAFYYEAAPLILARMKAAGAERSLLGYYVTHILPCALMARAGLGRPTYWLYRDLMWRLCRRYLPDHDSVRAAAQGRRHSWNPSDSTARSTAA